MKRTRFFMKRVFILLPAGSDRIGEVIWQKGRLVYISANAVGMNHLSGWDNVRGAGSGILL